MTLSTVFVLLLLLLLSIIATIVNAQVDHFHAGFIQTDEVRNHNLFYWVFDSRNNVATDPVIMWSE
jgi:hypothetical protein